MSFLSDIRHDRTKAHVVPLAVFMVLLAPFQLTGWPVRHSGTAGPQYPGTRGTVSTVLQYLGQGVRQSGQWTTSATV